MSRGLVVYRYLKLLNVNPTSFIFKNFIISATNFSFQSTAKSIAVKAIPCALNQKANRSIMAPGYCNTGGQVNLRFSPMYCDSTGQVDARHGIFPAHSDQYIYSLESLTNSTFYQTIHIKIK
jgi:hypothetical protein